MPVQRRSTSRDERVRSPPHRLGSIGRSNGKTLAGGLRALGDRRPDSDYGDVPSASGSCWTARYRDASRRGAGAGCDGSPVCRCSLAEPTRFAEWARDRIAGRRFDGGSVRAARGMDPGIAPWGTRTMGFGFASMRRSRLLPNTARRAIDLQGGRRTCSQDARPCVSPRQLRRRHVPVLGPPGMHRSAWRAVLHHIGRQQTLRGVSTADAFLCRFSRYRRKHSLRFGIRAHRHRRPRPTRAMQDVTAGRP